MPLRKIETSGELLQPMELNTGDCFLTRQHYRHRLDWKCVSFPAKPSGPRTLELENVTVELTN